MRTVIALLIAVLVAAGTAVFVALRQPGPSIEIIQPTAVVGQATPLDVVVNAPGGRLTRLDIAIEQVDRRHPLFALPGTDDAALTQEATDRVRVTREVGKRTVGELRAGPARIVVTADRPRLFGLGTVSATAAHDVQVRLDPPRLSIVSMHHFVNHGGSEMVVYRVTPADAVSGVQVGDLVYPGFPATGAGITGADPSLQVAFFALLWDQDLDAPISVFARDEAGNESRATFASRVFPKPFRKSRIDVSDGLLRRVVPEILRQTPDLHVDDPSDLLSGFLAVNGPLRRENASAIAALGQRTSDTILWQGPFVQLAGSKVESSFADQRTYFYENREIDRQVHLGFDLAVTANHPVHAGNRGTVIFADYLGIYGNTVVLDHGMGLQSLYAHLSSIDVRPGDTVDKGGILGRSGMTGLAGGDHLHFTMLLHGHPVTPVDWWSKQWIEDRILRKLREAGAH
jgi:murein DD-endopeptidase MepM/ murein hydrolase activator NlpD